MPHTKRLEHAQDRLLLILAAMLILLVILTVVFFVTAHVPADDSRADGSSTAESGTAPVDRPVDAHADVILPATPDAGPDYQDKLIFVGDSLTAHLKSRGVLTGGQATTQVWTTESNMLNLKPGIHTQKIVFPGTGELLTIAEAAARAKPEILVITLGTDWGVAYLGEADFKSCYAGLIMEIQKASPGTQIVLQSIFPVTKGCTVLDNTKIDTANKWVKAVAAENRCRYLDTQSILKDETNCLKADYCNSGDGIHLATEAYVAILTYIRTHAVSD